MKAGNRRKSTNIRDLPAEERAKKKIIAKKSMRDNLPDDAKAASDKASTAEIQELQDIRQAIQTTPEDAIRKTHSSGW